MIARGLMLGPDQPVVLHMLDIPRSAETLNGVRMELIDAALPLLRGVHRLLSVFGVHLLCVFGVDRLLLCALLQVSWQRATRPKRSEASTLPS